MTIPDGITEAQNYKDAPEDIRASVEQLIRDFGSDPALLAGAIVSATSRAIQAAQEAERERAASYHDDMAAQHEAFRSEATGVGMEHHAKMVRFHVLSAERIRKGA